MLGETVDALQDRLKDGVDWTDTNTHSFEPIFAINIGTNNIHADSLVKNYYNG